MTRFIQWRSFYLNMLRWRQPYSVVGAYTAKNSSNAFRVSLISVPYPET